jgi:hypothetical protein
MELEKKAESCINSIISKCSAESMRLVKQWSKKLTWLERFDGKEEKIKNNLVLESLTKIYKRSRFGDLSKLIILRPDRVRMKLLI